MTQAANEQHLISLLNDFDRKMYLNYMDKVEALKSEMQNLKLEDSTDIIKTPDMLGTTALRLLFDIPIHIMLSHPICRFKSQKMYPVGEKLFIAHLGLVPIYFANMNTMTVMKTWGRDTQNFFSQINAPLPEIGAACWEFSNRSRAIEYSTMNFILGQGSDKISKPQYVDVFDKYLRFAYWSFPGKGFTFSTQLLHRSDKITSVMKVAKSLYIVIKIGSKQTKYIEGQTLECRECLIKGLSKDDNSYLFTKPIDVLIEEDLADKIITSKKDTYGFLNGMITEVRQPFSRDKFLTVVQDYGESYSDFNQSLIGIVSMSRYAENDTISFVGKLNEIIDEINKISHKIYLQVELKTSIADAIHKSFSSLIESMFPVFVADKNEIFYTHPIIISFLLSHGMTMDVLEKDRKILVCFLRLLDMKKVFQTLFLSDEMEYLSSKGMPKNETIKSIMKLSRFVKISKLFEKTINFDKPYRFSSLRK